MSTDSQSPRGGDESPTRAEIEQMVEEAVERETADLRDELADTRRELAETRKRADRAEAVAHTAIQQFRVNADHSLYSTQRFSRLMDRLVRIEKRVDQEGGGDVTDDHLVDRAQFMPIHRAYMDVRDGVERDLEPNERRGARLFKDVLERGDTSFGKLKYDSGDARRFLESEGDITNSGRSKTVTRSLRTLSIMSKDPATGERLFEFKQPKTDDVRNVMVAADVDDVKEYLDRVESLLDDVATNRVVESVDGGDDQPDDEPVPDEPDETDDAAADVDAEIDELTSAEPGDELESTVETDEKAMTPPSAGTGE